MIKRVLKIQKKVYTIQHGSVEDTLIYIETYIEHYYSNNTEPIKEPQKGESPRLAVIIIKIIVATGFIGVVTTGILSTPTTQADISGTVIPPNSGKFPIVIDIYLDSIDSAQVVFENNNELEKSFQFYDVSHHISHEISFKTAGYHTDSMIFKIYAFCNRYWNINRKWPESKKWILNILTNKAN